MARAKTEQLLCGYCPRRFKFAGDWRDDATYRRHAETHEGFGPSLDEHFVRSPAGQIRAPRPIPVAHDDKTESLPPFLSMCGGYD